MLLKLDNKRSKRWMHSATQNNLVYWNADVCFAHPPPSHRGRGGKYCDEHVCSSVRSHISETTRLACGRDSLPLWERCDVVCISGFVDEVPVSYNELYSASCVFLRGESVSANTLHLFQPDRNRQVHVMGWAPGWSLLSAMALFNTRLQHCVRHLIQT